MRSVTPDDGLGEFAGSVGAVGEQVVAWARAGWTPDVFLETHTNAAGPNARGVLVIYPDWGDDVDVGVRDVLGPAIVINLHAGTDLPVWRTGLLSERETMVGQSGSRLAVFGRTAGLRATMARLLVEFGHHTHPADLERMQQPDFAALAATAVLNAFSVWIVRRHLLGR